MSLLDKIIKEVLLEDVSVNKVNDAIKNTYEVVISYRSHGENIATGHRTIQPVAYGLTKRGNPVIRAFQPYGDTTTKIPAWKFFRIDRIISWVPLRNKTFEEPPGMFSAEGEFNPDGDETMSMVYTIANFGNRRGVNYRTQNNKGPVTKDSVNGDTYKTNTEKAMARLRQQLDNPQYLSGYTTNKGKNTNIGPISKRDVNRNGETKNRSNNVKNDMMNGPITKDDVNKDKVFKTDTEMAMERLRQQLVNPTYISDIIKTKNFGDDNQSVGPINKKDLNN